MKKGMKIFRMLLTTCALSGIVVGSTAFAKEKPKSEKDNLAKSQGVQAYKPERYNLLNINNLISWHRNDGLSNHSTGGDNGVYYPRGTSYVIYEDGLVWGARSYVDEAKTIPAPYDQTIRVGGSTYGTNSRAGFVNGLGADAIPSGQDDPDARMFRIRRDWRELKVDGVASPDLIRDAAESNEVALANVTDAMVDLILEDYKFSWENWPVHLGAPYIDRNGNGQYDPPPADSSAKSLIENGYDEPGVAGIDPNSPADQVVWCVWNDLNRTQATSRFGSEPMGLEVQMTMWGYKRQDSLGDMYFKKWRFINKGGVQIDNAGTIGGLYLDSMYVCQWSDPDLGTFGDDLTGCDTTLSMGFIYNGNAVDLEYRKHNLPPPAAGYDFLQGPAVPSPGDVAVFDLKYKQDFKNLGMTGFSYFSAGSPYSDPGGGYATNTIYWYKMLRGFAPLGGEDARYNHPPGFEPGAFPLSGDPVSKAGFIDGLGTDYSFPPGDRRLLTITGPFALALGDTQEVVVSLVVGLGADRLSSVSVMKFNDEVAQSTYDALFQVPAAPAPPKVAVQELDQEIILEWGSPAGVDETENKVSMPGAFKFEGYNVYQLPTGNSSLSDGKRIATYDVINEETVILDRAFDKASGSILTKAVQFGSNSGVERNFKFDRDLIRDVPAINNGTEYYLAVTAYSVATDPTYTLRSLESPMQIITVKAKRPFGVQYDVALADTMAAATHVAGGSDGAVYPVVVDATVLSGDNYRVSFTDVDEDGVTEFNLENITTGAKLITGGTNQTGDSDYLTTEGFQARVVGAPLEFKNFTAVANGAGPIDPPVGAAADFRDFPVPNRPGASQQVGAGMWMVTTGGQRPNYSEFLDRTTNGGTRWGNIIPKDFEWRFTATGGYALMAYSTHKIVPVPFELWYIGIGTPDDPSDDVRMVPFIFDEDGNDAFNLMAIDHPQSGASNDPYTDWVYWTMPIDQTPGDAGYKGWEAAVLALPDSIDTDWAVTDLHATEDHLRRTVLMNWNGGDVTVDPPVFNQEMPETGTIIRMETTKPNALNDVFEFTTVAPVSNKDLALQSVENIGVFPNPYYAYNPLETNRLEPFVTFNNLPPKATLRIFNLAGQLVRTLNKDDDSQFLRWDLQNFGTLPVASGVYIVHIDLPDLQVQKTLKLTVVAENPVLDVY